MDNLENKFSKNKSPIDPLKMNLRAKKNLISIQKSINLPLILYEV